MLLAVRSSSMATMALFGTLSSPQSRMPRKRIRSSEVISSFLSTSGHSDGPAFMHGLATRGPMTYWRGAQ